MAAPSTTSSSTQMDTFNTNLKEEVPQKMELNDATGQRVETSSLSSASIKAKELTPNQLESQPAGAVIQITRRAAILLFIGLAMATFLASLDGTIIATALPKIASDYNAKAEMSWVATAYLLTFNAFQPLYGKFSDIFGRKVMILFACVTFMVGSAGAGAATTMTMLIVFRAIQGLGGSGLLSIVLIIISDIFSIEERPKYQSIIWSVFGISSVIGPLLGGAFVDHASWRWCFYINLPLGVITLASVIVFLRLPFESQKLKEQLARIDYIGTLLIIAVVVCLLLPITWGGVEYPWNHGAIIGLFCVAAALIATLVYAETKAYEAIVPPRLFKNFNVATIFLVNFFTGIGFLGVIFYSPIYFQVVKGNGATASGLKLLPMVLGLVFASILSGAIMAKIKDPRYFIWIGAALVPVGVGLCILLDENSSMGEEIGFLLIVGAGVGLILQTAMIAAQASVEKEDMAVVTALCGFFNSIGGAIGIAMCTALFNNHLAAKMKELPADVLMGLAKYPIAESITVVQTLPAELKAPLVAAYVDSFSYIFTVVCPISCVAFVISLFIRRFRHLDPSEMIMGAA
ncbi:hypothetical protein DFQ27_000343 [Actinomortierella ambigua]|uniref:Major facilitator superfamily (MFS) profile domain-containing protein n=1 Tax=Actinomortierella ambigua TaxID=1343610 RepID=A0A9P6QH53_9FUNG|nr:hypothetical protein DFQ27_000343 [Actinomortierella ambigua]